MCRRLLNYGYEETVQARAPSTPQVRVATYPPPAVSSSSTTVRAERPSLDVQSKTPANFVTSQSKTDVKVAPQKPFPVGGKGSWTVVNLSRGPTTAVQTTDAAVNWGSSSSVVNSGNPLSVTHEEGSLVPNPSHYTTVSVSPQLGDRPDGFVEVRRRANVPLGK